MNCIERIQLCIGNFKNNSNVDDSESIIIYKNKQNDNFKECIICLEDMKYNEKLILVKCSHIYHKECLEKWIKKNNVCPLCDIKI